MVPRDIVIRTDNPTSMATVVRQRIWEVDRKQPVSNIATLDDILDAEVHQRRMEAMLLAAFSALALTLACVGLYGVLAFLVSQRTAEIGVRMALGAQRGDIIWNVVGRGLVLGVIGIAFGLVGALVSTRVLSSLLFGVSVRDPMTFIAVSALMLFVASMASIIPARRAVLVDPITALRNE